ncbi:MAG: heme exporter protein CcmD [Hyphomicrobiaceae bacterium]|nr:heme exporter protein CcmD [Hyphomicrobiaceae bacterium]
MIDLGPHTRFIVVAYVLAAAVLAALIVWLYADGRRLAARLKELDERGVKRRSATRGGQTPSGAGGSNAA